MVVKNNKYFANSIFIFLVLFSIAVNVECQEVGQSVVANAYSHQVIDYGQVVYGTLIVLVILGLAIFLLKKSRLNKFGQQELVEVISSLPVTTKDKLMIIRIGQDYLVLGVSSGGINKIHTLTLNDIEKLTNSKNSQLPNFSNIYAATIGKFHNA